MIASRIFAALAALFLVGAVAIAALTPFGMTLGQGLMLMDGTWFNWIQQQSPAWSWTWLELPFLSSRRAVSMTRCASLHNS